MPRPATHRTAPAETALTVIGLLSLTIITLWYPGTSQMHTGVGRGFYWLALLVPLVGCALRFAATRDGLTLPRTSTLLLLLLAALIILSAWFSPHRAQALRWSAPWLAGIALYFWASVARQSAAPAALKKTEQTAAIAAVLVAGVSLAYWATAMLSFATPPQSLTEVLNYRNAAPLGHANYTAGLVVIGLPWVWQAVKSSRGGARLAWATGLLLLLAALFSSGSRGGMIGFAVIVTLEILALRLPLRRLLFIGGVALALAALFAVSNPRIRDLLRPDADPNAPPNLSSVQRLAMAEAGWHMGLDRPLLGWGLHTTPLIYPRYRGQLDGGTETVLQLHNTPLEIWSGLGAVGLLFVGALLILALSRWRSHPTAAITLGGFGVFALTDYQLDVPFFVAAVALAGACLAPRSGPQLAAMPRARVIGPALSAGVILIVALLGARDPAPRLNVEALQRANAPGETAAAIAQLRESLQLNPTQEIAHFNLGWLLITAAPEVAAQHFTVAAHLVPDKGGVYLGLALARLNQAQPEACAQALALECLNDPGFLYAPWWRLEPLAALRDQTRQRLAQYLNIAAQQTPPLEQWRQHGLQRLRAALPQLGQVPDGPVRRFQRERSGYPVLMRNLDLPPPHDVFTVQELVTPPDYATTLPAKGWLPAPLLLRLLRTDP